MARISGFLSGDFLLGPSHRAIAVAIALILLPYTAWIAVALVALVTLRKGWQHGLYVLMPVCAVYLVVSRLSVPIADACCSAVVLFVPCYLAACVLGALSSWRSVALVFLIQAIFVALLVQHFFPGFIIEQYAYMQAALNNADADPALLALLHNKTILRDDVLANYCFGIQIWSIALSAMISLMFARLAQSRLYYPGGFKQEMLSFRGKNIDVLLFFVVFAAALQQYAIAMNLVPVLFFYFMLIGFSVSAAFLNRKKMRGVVFLLLLPLLVLPFVMLPGYVFLGLLDSLFNMKARFSRK